MLLRRYALNTAFRLKMLWEGKRYLRYSKKALEQPEVVQQQCLMEILCKNSQTQFGKKHGFENIHSFEEYAQAVPIQSYESLRPYIDRQIAGEAHSLTFERPLSYAQTSGTTDQPKLLPVTATSMAMHRINQGVFTWVQYRSNPEAFSGQMLGFAGAAEEGRVASGIPYGSVSGVMYRSMPKFAQAKFVVPYSVFEIEDYTLRYLTIARLALAEGHVTYMAAANPTTFLRLLDVIKDNFTVLVDDVEKGIFTSNHDLEPQIQQAIALRLKASRSRARSLRRIKNVDGISFHSLWPSLKMAVTWTGGSCGVAVDVLRTLLSEETQIFDLGYVSSEFFGSITMDSGKPKGLPTLYANVFEFVERDAWDEGERKTLRLGQLEMDKEYQIIVSTMSGLYRYFMNDILRVTGFLGQTPLFAFVQKGKGVTNLCGEKLYEAQVIKAVQATCSQLGLNSCFYLMLADEKAHQYRLYIEPLETSVIDHDEIAQSIDQQLSENNIEYAAKRTSQRLQRAEVYYLAKGTGDACKMFYVAKGRREQQFKLLLVQYRKDLEFPIENHVHAAGVHA